MEVHHHPHAEEKVQRIFFGVPDAIPGRYAWLLAEALREHMGDRSKEKALLATMFEELKYDTAQYHAALHRVNLLNPALDSCYMNVKKAGQFNYLLAARWNTPVNETRVSYKPALPAINQLKSSGNLRLIEERDIAAKVMEYETFIDGTYQDHYANVDAATKKVFALEDELCDYTDFNAKLGENMSHLNGQLNQEGSALYDMEILVKDPVKLNALANSFCKFQSKQLWLRHGREQCDKNRHGVARADQR